MISRINRSIVALDPTTNTVISRFDNAASVTYQGFELETQYVFNEYFRMFFNYGSLDAEYDEFEADINPNDGVDIVEDGSYLNPRNAPVHLGCRWHADGADGCRYLRSFC